MYLYKYVLVLFYSLEVFFTMTLIFWKEGHYTTLKFTLIESKGQIGNFKVIFN